MSAVRIEGKAWADPRIAAMAAVGNYEIDEAIGRLARLWLWCTERQTYVVPAWLVWSIVKIKDADFVAVEMGEWADEEGTLIRVKGTKGRIEWLGEKRAASARGGEATRRKWAESGPNEGQSQASTRPNEGQTGAEPRPSLGPLSLSPTLINSESKTPKVPTGDVSFSSKRGRPRKAKPNEPTDPERASVRIVLDKLGGHNGVRYTASDAHTRLIVARLRDGLSEMDLRIVVRYCAEELEWKSKPNMLPYLRPETLFGPQTISKYLDAARSWHETLPTDEPTNGTQHDPAFDEPEWMGQ